MTRMEAQVSVILCAYTEDRWELLCAAVDSLQQQELAPAEIILVVDHNPALLERARREFLNLKVIPNDGEPGLSGARNTGLAAADGQIIAFMDEDARAAPDWLACLVESYRDPHVMGVGGSIQPRWPGSRPGWFPEEFQWVVGCTYRGLPAEPQPVRNLIGCNMSFRCQAFQIAGGFREGIGRVGKRPLGDEETELCIRLAQRQPGSVLFYDPHARVEHTVSAERTTAAYFLSRCYAEGISKALIAALVGSDQGLASERTYTLRTLPSGFLVGLKDAMHGDLWGLARSAAILTGLAFTSAGYLVGRLSRLARPPAAAPEFRPARLLEVELIEPLPDIQPKAALTGETYAHALCLVRLETRPLGFIPLDLPGGSLAAAVLAAQIWAALGAQIQGILPGLTQLAPQGLSLHLEDSPNAQESNRYPLASVVIATRDRPASLERTLESLIQQDYPNFELLVVDNAPSSDATQALIQGNSRFSARVRYIREETAGLALAHNTALAEVNGEIVAFTDDDVLLDPHWLSRLVQAFEITDGVACVTGMILPLEMETPSQAWIEQFGGFGKGFNPRVFGGPDYQPASPLYPYAAGTFGSGANMAFRTAVLRQIGGFDPALGAGTPALGGDDLAAFFEVLARGYRLVYQPAAFLYHLHRRDYPGLRRQAYGYGVGLSAFLSKTLLDHPARLIKLAARLPAGISYLLSPRSPKNQKKSSGYPRELTWLELKGFLHGPLAYLRSRRRWKHTRAHLAGNPSISANTQHYAKVADKISLQ